MIPKTKFNVSISELIDVYLEFHQFRHAPIYGGELIKPYPCDSKEPEIIMFVRGNLIVSFDMEPK